MSSRDKRSLGYAISTVIFAILTGYFFWGVVTAAWLSATPNFPVEAATRWANLWGALSAICLLTMITSIIFYCRERKKPRN